MELITWFNTKFDGDTAVAMGLFDGVHKGHQKVIAQAVGFKGQGLRPAVFTMDCSEGIISSKQGNLIITEWEKRSRLEELGVEIICSLPFEEIKSMSPKQFIEEVVINLLSAKVVVCGADFTFGKGGKADVTDLVKICCEYGIEVVVVPFVKDQDDVINSKAIRKLLLEGDIEKVNRYLGRNYSYSLPVISGQSLGKKIGFPTINQRIPPLLAEVRKGVYKSRTTINDKHYDSITNVGIKPTVGSDVVTAETNIGDFSGDLYGQTIRVELIEFIRDERKFESVEKLVEQIKRDVQQVGMKIDGLQ